MYPLNDPPDYEPPSNSSIAAVARRRGISPEALAYDMLLEDDGGGCCSSRPPTISTSRSIATLEMLKHRDTVPALGDGGAHLGVMCDATYSTFMLTHWARDRQRASACRCRRGEGADARYRERRRAERSRPAPPRLIAPTSTVIDFDRLRLGLPKVMTDCPPAAAVSSRRRPAMTRPSCAARSPSATARRPSLARTAGARAPAGAVGDRFLARINQPACSQRSWRLLWPSGGGSERAAISRSAAPSATIIRPAHPCPRLSATQAAERIVHALARGVMRTQAAGLSESRWAARPST